VKAAGRNALLAMIRISEHLRGHLEDLHSIPVAPVEPRIIELRAGEDGHIGSVFDPDGATVLGVQVKGIPAPFSRPESFHFSLVLRPALTATHPEREAAALESIAHHVSVAAILEPPVETAEAPHASTLQALPFITKPSPSSRCVVVTVVLPKTGPSLVGYSVCISRVTIAGQAVQLDFALPVRAVIVAGLSSPLWLPAPGFGAYQIFTPAVSRCGNLFVPQYYKPFCVFNCDGTPIPAPDISGLGLLSADSITAAGICDLTNTLFLGDCSLPGGIVALDQDSYSVRWAAPAETLRGCSGIAVLSPQGVVVAASKSDRMLHVFRIMDGALLASVPAGGEGPLVSAAADPETSTVFVGHKNIVFSYAWDGASLSPIGEVEAAGRGENYEYRALAVMPPAHGASVSHLLVATWGSGEFIALSLPDYHVAFRGPFRCPISPGGAPVTVNFRGIAADPTGRAVVICERIRETVFVVPWPMETLRV
jgi:hypothetical protein